MTGEGERELITVSTHTHAINSDKTIAITYTYTLGTKFAFNAVWIAYCCCWWYCCILQLDYRMHKVGVRWNGFNLRFIFFIFFKNISYHSNFRVTTVQQHLVHLNVPLLLSNFVPIWLFIFPLLNFNDLVYRSLFFSFSELY